MLRFKKFVGIGLLVTMIFTVISGCSSSSTGASPSSAETTQTYKEKEVVIGMTAAFSGTSAEYAENNKMGIEWAIEEINAAGGIIIGDERVTFRLETLDDTNDGTIAASNAQKLVDLYDCIIIFNNSTTSLLPLLNFNETEGSEFIVTAYASHSALTNKGNSLAVALVPNYKVYPAVYADMAIEKGYTTAGLFCNTGTYGDDWEKLFTEAFEAKGGKITISKEANYFTESDYSAQVTAIAAANPDCVLLGGPSTGTALAIEQLRSMGYTGSFFLIDQAKSDEVVAYLGGDASVLANCFGMSPMNWLPFVQVQDFCKKIEETYGITPSADMGFTYAGMHMFAKAMEYAQSYSDAYAIRAAIEQVIPLDASYAPYVMRGISSGGRMQNQGGVVGFDEDGNPAEYTCIVWYKDTEAEYEEEKAWLESCIDPSLNIEAHYIWSPLPENVQ